MKAIVTQFNRSNTNYERLLHSLLTSWQRHSRISIEIDRIDAPELGSRHYSFYNNNAKLQSWVEAVDQDTIFVDADMLCLGDISDGFDQVEHIGITVRPGSYPINGGVVFVKNTYQAKEFLQRWADLDTRMLHDVELHMRFHKKYAGLNQSSLGKMVEDYPELVTELPCSSYNLCDGQWNEWRAAKMIHIKGNLRDLVLEGKLEYPHNQSPHLKDMKEIRSLWEEYQNLPIYK